MKKIYCDICGLELTRMYLQLDAKIIFCSPTLLSEYKKQRKLPLEICPQCCKSLVDRAVKTKKEQVAE